jgi:hypothetical protein
LAIYVSQGLLNEVLVGLGLLSVELHRTQPVGSLLADLRLIVEETVLRQMLFAEPL